MTTRPGLYMMVYATLMLTLMHGCWNMTSPSQESIRTDIRREIKSSQDELERKIGELSDKLPEIKTEYRNGKVRAFYRINGRRLYLPVQEE